MTRASSCAVLFALSGLTGCGGSGQEEPAGPGGIDPQIKARLSALALPVNAAAPADPTNRFADDPGAAAFGQKLFFDSRFSGPLLDEANDGSPATLGMEGEAGRVSCAGCHIPGNGSFVDTRSSRDQLSLAAGWTHRRTPALLDIAQAPLLGWDGRRSTAYAVAFAVIESPLEFNSSRLFVAQQIERLYGAEYEQVFGPLPALTAYAPLDGSQAGCTALPSDPLGQGCPKPGQDDPEVTRIVVNAGKAMAAYMRLLTCGPSRFDAWLGGDPNALTAEEQAGAQLFVGKGKCDGCHSGPYLSDQKFHNVGAPGGLLPFTGVDNRDDRGAEVGLAGALDDQLGPRGPFSDGDDGRLDSIPDDLAMLAGAFRTPGLRCLDGRPSFFHSALYRSIYDVMDVFNNGGSSGGFVGSSELTPLGLTEEELDQLIAFLKALQGPGPAPELRTAPALP